MTVTEILAALASSARTTPLDQLPAIPAAWLRDDAGDAMDRLIAALQASAIPIARMHDQVSAAAPAGTLLDRGPTQSAPPVWTRAALGPDAPMFAPDPNAPPLLELVVPPDRLDLAAWVVSTHTGRSLRTRWFVARGDTGSLAVLYVDAPLPDGTIVRFHLVFDLWVAAHAAIVERIDQVGQVGITMPALRQPGRTVQAGGKAYQPFTGVLLEIAVPFRQALAADVGLETLDPAVSWRTAIRAVAATVQVQPDLTPASSAAPLTSYTIGEARGARLILMVNPAIYDIEEGYLYPPGQVIALNAIGPEPSTCRMRMEETIMQRVAEPSGRIVRWVARPVTQVRPGWTSVSIVCARRSAAGWAFAWELCLQYRRLRETPAEQAIWAALNACLDEAQNPGGVRARELPLIHYPALWLLAGYGADLDLLRDGLRLMIDREGAIHMILLGWLAMIGITDTSMTPAELRGRDVGGQLALVTIHRMLMPVADLVHLVSLGGERAWLAVLDAIRARAWETETAMLAMLHLIMGDHGPTVSDDALGDALAGCMALVVLACPRWRGMRVHASCLPAAEEARAATHLACGAFIWRWLQEAVLNGQSANDYTAPRLPAAIRAWLTAGADDQTPAWSSIEALPDAPVTDADAQILIAVCQEFTDRAAAGVRPVVGGYRPRIPTEGFPQLARLGVTELKVWMSGAGGGWFAFGPADAAPTVLPFIPANGPIGPWRLLIPERLAWELALILNAWYCDMRVAGAPAAMPASAPRREPVPRRHARQGGGGPGTLYVPRRGARARAPAEDLEVLVGDYVADSDRAEVHRRVAEAHGVRAHVWRRTGVTLKRRAIQQRAWQQLDAATRLQILFGGAAPAGAEQRSLDYPPIGQIRGMTVTEQEDGRLDVALGYQRGGRRDDGADGAPVARTVVCQSYLAARAAMQLITGREV